MFCELCSGEAALYCPSDSAFLCWNCDAKVHGANFLVARHIRHPVCSKCKALTGESGSAFSFRFTGATTLCSSCSSKSSSVDSDSLSSSSASSCVSSAQSHAIGSVHGRAESTKLAASSSGNSCACRMKYRGMAPAIASSRIKRSSRTSTSGASADPKAEGIFRNWCRNLGISSGGPVARMACEALRVCLEGLTVLPLRVCLAASLWFGLRFCGDRPVAPLWHLKRLEEISGVPAKLLAVAESKIRRALKLRRQPQLVQVQEEEGWAECSA